jgi:hypothetical protein
LAEAEGCTSTQHFQHGVPGRLGYRRWMGRSSGEAGAEGASAYCVLRTAYSPQPKLSTASKLPLSAGRAQSSSAICCHLSSIIILSMRSEIYKSKRKEKRPADESKKSPWYSCVPCTPPRCFVLSAPARGPIYPRHPVKLL